MGTVTGVHDPDNGTNLTFSFVSPATLNDDDEYASGNKILSPTLTSTVASSTLTRRYFSIDAATGTISLRHSADVEQMLNYEKQKMYRAVVRAQDNGIDGARAARKSAEVLVTIHVNNINDPPSLPGEVFSVMEGTRSGTAVGRLIASDEDAQDAVTYALTKMGCWEVVCPNTSSTSEYRAIGQSLDIYATPEEPDAESPPNFSMTFDITSAGASHILLWMSLAKLNAMEIAIGTDDNSKSRMRSCKRASVTEQLACTDVMITETPQILSAVSPPKGFSIHLNNGTLLVGIGNSAVTQRSADTRDCTLPFTCLSQNLFPVLTGSQAMTAGQFYVGGWRTNVDLTRILRNHWGMEAQWTTDVPTTLRSTYSRSIRYKKTRRRFLPFHWFGARVRVKYGDKAHMSLWIKFNGPVPSVPYGRDFGFKTHSRGYWESGSTVNGRRVDQTFMNDPNVNIVSGDWVQISATFTYTSNANDLIIFIFDSILDANFDISAVDFQVRLVKECTNPTQTCRLIDQRECFAQVNGVDYRGFVNTTTSGKTCAAWTAQSPHAHATYNTPETTPGKGLGSHNYCRNPDNSLRPWCYTTDSSSRREFCDVGSANVPCTRGELVFLESNNVLNAPTEVAVSSANGAQTTFTSVCFPAVDAAATAPDGPGRMFSVDSRSGDVTTSGTGLPDFEGERHHSFEVSATDSNGITAKAIVRVDVQNVQEAPSFTNLCPDSNFAACLSIPEDATKLTRPSRYKFSCADSSCGFARKRVNEWLILGSASESPYDQNSGYLAAPRRNWCGVSRTSPFIAGEDEATLSPIEGETTQEYTVTGQSLPILTWSRLNKKRGCRPGCGGADNGKVSLKCHYNQRRNNVFTYAFVYLLSNKERSVQLRIGSDDGHIVWLNGEIVSENVKACRCYRENQDRVTVTLKEGVNRLLTKVGQRGGDWGFIASFDNIEGIIATTSLEAYETPPVSGEGCTYLKRNALYIKRAVDLASGLNTNTSLIYAWYGHPTDRTQGFVVTDKLQKFVSGNVLTIPRNLNGAFGDPLPGVVKSLIIQYFNKAGVRTELVKRQFACEGETINDIRAAVVSNTFSVVSYDDECAEKCNSHTPSRCVGYMLSRSGGDCWLIEEDTFGASNTLLAQAEAWPGDVGDLYIRNCQSSTVVATDSDTESEITYAITNGNVGNAFSIDAQSGQLQIANAVFDFETPARASWTLTVSATDNTGLMSLGLVSVSISDVNEAPTFAAAASNGPPTFSVREDIEVGGAIGTAVVATDVDAGVHGELEYSVCDLQDVGSWRCIASVGVPLRVNDQGNIECMSRNGRDCFWPGSKVPQRSCEAVLEAWRDYAQMRPLACGRSHKRLYRFTGYGRSTHWCAKGRAALDSTVVHREDFEGNQMNGWTCGAIQSCGTFGKVCGGYNQKGRGETIEKTYTVPTGRYLVQVGIIKIDSWDNERAILSINGAQCWQSDPYRYFHGPSNQCGRRWRELKMTATCVADVTGTSLRLTVSSTLNQPSNDESIAIDDVTISALATCTDSQNFEIDGNGQLRVRQQFDYETRNSYALKVTAADGGGLKTTTNVNIKIIDVNELPVLRDASASVPENSLAGTNVGSPLAVVDADSGQQIKFEIVRGNEDGMFKVNCEGQIQVGEGNVYRTSAKPCSELNSVGWGGTDIVELGRRFGSPSVCGFTQAGGRSWHGRVKVRVVSECCDNSDKTRGTCGIGYIYVNGRQVSPKRRGFNVVVINEYTGAVENSRAFDTSGSSTGSASLLTYLQSIASGRIVAIAVQDEATGRFQLSTAVLDEVRKLVFGHSIETIRWREPFALIGIKGENVVAVTEKQLRVQQASRYSKSAKVSSRLLLKTSGNSAGKCPAKMTLAETKTYCKAHGTRLCSFAELSAGETRGTGCHHDGRRIWSSTVCSDDGNSVLTIAGSPRNHGRLPRQCTPVTTKLYARCCADMVVQPPTTSLDFEQRSSYELGVRVKDDGMNPPALGNTATVQISVTDANEAPVLADAALSVAENSVVGTAVGAPLSARDPDAGQVVSYSITAGNALGIFRIDSLTGQVEVATTGHLNYEQPQAQVDIPLTLPHWTFSSGFLVANSIATAQASTDYMLSKTSFSRPISVEFELRQTGSMGDLTGCIGMAIFVQEETVTGTGGVGTSRMPVRGTGYSFGIGMNGNQWYTSSPSFTATDSDVENDPTIGLVKPVQGAGSDGQRNFQYTKYRIDALSDGSINTYLDGQLKASFADSTHNEGFIAVPSGCVAVSVRSIKYMAVENSEYSFQVTATDNGSPALSTTAEVTVAVTDVNEPPTFEASPARSVAENSPVGTALGRAIGAIDPDKGQSLHFSIQESGAVQIVGNRGE